MRNMNDILRQAQVMQNKLAKLQQEMADKTYEAASGGGMVKAVVSGKQELLKLEIDPQAVAGGDVEMLQDLILAAINDAMSKAADIANERMGKVTGGMKLPF